MKRIFFGIMVMLAFAACTKDEIPAKPEVPEAPATPETPAIEKIGLQFNAKAPATTKTSLNQDDRVFWTEGDAISIFSLEALRNNERFTSISITESDATFSGTAVQGEQYYAVYPYTSGNKIEGSTLKIKIPAEQALLNGSFANGTNPSVAVSDGGILEFRNIAALISFQVPELNGRIITRAVFKGNAGEKIAGAMTVDMNSITSPAVPAPEALTEVTLTGTFTAGEVYYMVTAPAAFSSGIKLSLYDDKGNSYSISGSRAITTHAGEILPLGSFELVPDIAPGSIYVKPDGIGDGSSWANATTLANAISLAEEGNTIHLAAGKYLPEGKLTNSFAFILTRNVNLIGGYPADATEGALADPANKTILSANKSGRVLMIAAPKPAEGAMEVRNIVITEGKADRSTKTPEINGAKGIDDGRGGGIMVLNSKVIFRNCEITDNYTARAPALYNAENSETELIGCKIHKNTAYDNGSGIWNTYAKLIIKNCEFYENINIQKGVGGSIYALGETAMKSVPTMTYIYNSVFKDNSVASDHKDYNKIYLRGGAVYAREGSKTIILNSTFHQNKAGSGSAITLYGTSNAHSYLHLVNCTVTGNRAYFRAALEEASEGAGKGQRYAHMNVFNTIVSGNTAEQFPSYTEPVTNPVPDVFVSPSAHLSLPETFACSINGAKVYGNSNNLLEGYNFNPGNMLSPYVDGVIRLQGTGNPARTIGMDTSELNAIDFNLYPDLDLSYLGIDQKNNPRTGRTIGACVE